MGKFDTDLSLNHIKPKNLKQYAQMKIAERRKNGRITKIDKRQKKENLLMYCTEASSSSWL